MSTQIIPIILAGGSGTRLWPLSRKNFPKQFLRLQGKTSLLQQTLQRVLQLPVQEICIVSNEAHYFLCQEQLEGYSSKINYILEPCARNTAPAIAAAAHYIAEQINQDAILLILPSDHWIAEDDKWTDAMLKAAKFAQANHALVTFGIKPISPKTGYGYIEADNTAAGEILSVKSFREKPDELTAQTFVEDGNYYWNSGMFVCRADTYLKELNLLHPTMYQKTLDAVKKGSAHNDYYRLDSSNFAACADLSIDYAIMENTSKAVVMPLAIQWSDLGCWTAVAEANIADEHGNTIHGKVIAKDSHDCLISSEKVLVTTLGIKDQIIVATPDAILVADKKYSQQVKDIVSNLGTEHGQLANEHQRVHRPWGYFEVLAEGPTFKVKRLMIKPKAKISLQMHMQRAEHWVVVGGEAEVIRGEQILHLAVNQSTYIPQKTQHRLSNPGDEPLFVIEVQSGSYLGEDDIIRYEDMYQRELV
jgi:mannose-1-phosphate guanylyltransferase/mannose-6-phosphate isomerase